MIIPSRMFPQTVSYGTPGGYDDYGRPIEGDLTEVPARIEESSRIVRNDAGTEVSARATVRMPGDVDLDGVNTLNLPEGARQVISVRKIMGARTNAYTEVYVS